MKKVTFFSILLVLIFSSCATTKSTTKEVGEIKKMSARKVVKKHLENVFEAKTVDSKIKVTYASTEEGKRKRHTFTVRLRMQKDSVIWIKGNKVITVFKARITPNSFSFYAPQSKVYFEGDYRMLYNMLGVEINFSQLQNMLTGQSIFEMKGKRYKASIEGDAYKLTPKTQKELFDVFFRINPRHFKLNQLYIKNEKKKQSLRVDYNEYKQFDKTRVPVKMTINAIEDLKYTFLNLDYKSVIINKPINIRYRVPKNYKRITIE